MQIFQNFTSAKTYSSSVKTELGWVHLGGKKSSVHVQSNRISTDVKTLDLETFSSIDSYGTVKKPDRILMTKDILMAFWYFFSRYLFQEAAL